MIKTLQRWFCLFVLRSLQRQLNDQTTALRQVQDEATRIRIVIARMQTRRELEHVESRYMELKGV